MHDGTAPAGYHPIAEAFSGGVDVGMYVAFAVIAVLLVASSVRRFLGTA